MHQLHTSNIRHQYSILIIFLSTIFLIAGFISSSALAQTGGTVCHLFNSNSQPLAGFAPAHNVFSAARELLVQITCSSSGAVVTAGGNPSGQITYQIMYASGYKWMASQNKWVPITFTGTPYSGTTAWLSGSGTVSLSLAQIESGTNYVVAYTCVYVNNQWNCGCSDTSCITHKWQLQAFDSSNGGGTGADTIVPTVSIFAPSAGAVVAGTVILSANASDPAIAGQVSSGVSKVEFYVDSVLKVSDVSSPYTYSWDTTNGGAHPCNGAHTHTLQARAYDVAGNQGTSINVVVNMNNPAYCTTPTPTPTPIPNQTSIPTGITSINQTSSWTQGKILLNNFFNVGNAYVLYDPLDAAFPYKMWFYGWVADICNSKYNGCDAIFYARSVDGNQWQVYAGTIAGSPKFDTTMNSTSWVPVITAENKYYDQWHNGDPSVVRIGNVYYMAYSALGFDKDSIPEEDAKDTDNSFLDVMGAVSSDGIHWQKRSAPLLVSSVEYGAYEPAANSMYHRPSLMYEDGKFKIWFDYWVDNTKGLSMGYAELPGTASSATFLTGTPALIRSGSNPAISQWPNPAVVHVGSKYYSYADPPQYYNPNESPWQARKITEAVSSDGIHWQVTGYINPESGCAATQIPETYYAGDGNVYVTYGCFTKFTPFLTSASIRRMWKPL